MDSRLRKRRPGAAPDHLLADEEQPGEFTVQTPPSSLNSLASASPQWKYAKAHRRRRNRKPKIVNTCLAGVCAALVSGGLSAMLLPRLTDAQTAYLRSLVIVMPPAPEPSATFEYEYLCRDGTTRGARNDDYCDCPDGDDEPDTAACAGVRPGAKLFRCRDGGATTTLSRVRDGVRDCPDGSDEK